MGVLPKSNVSHLHTIGKKEWQGRCAKLLPPYWSLERKRERGERERERERGREREREREGRERERERCNQKRPMPRSSVPPNCQSPSWKCARIKVT